jgi:4-diphosphocytidyl-2-C-methyl-D-erythritol kinase
VSHPVLRARAPAKVNLTLGVRRRSTQGWHDLVSLVAFAGIGDHVSLKPGDELGLSLAGAGAAALAADGADNLVLRAARALAGEVPGLRVGHFALHKRLPVAAGLGGGSSDAAAALRLLARHNDLPLDHPAVLAAAKASGADVSVCLSPRARYFFGRGEEVSAPLALAPLAAVLVNPGVALSTAAVFAALGLAPGAPGPSAGRAQPPLSFAGPAQLHRWLAGEPNDLEPPARALVPAIGDVLDALRGAPGCTLARMSGSGASAFGLFADCHAAARAARLLRAGHPSWWVAPTVLR